MPTVPFTATQVAQIRYYCGYPAFAVFGYVLSPGMATLDDQIAGMSDAEQALVVSEFLAVLPGLKSAIDNATSTLYVATAGPFTRNPEEMTERVRQYTLLRQQLCAFIGCPPGDQLVTGNRVTRG